MGAAARAMSNFGFSSLRVVKPYDPAFREARSAVDAYPILSQAREYTNLRDAVADCSLVVGTTTGRDRDLKHPLQRLEGAAKILHAELRSGPAALLFGSEKSGLSNTELSHCHWLLRIPTREEHSSMNLGQAVAVCLYELVRQDRSASQQEMPELSPTADSDRITAILLESARLSGYLPANSGQSAENKIRRLVRRLTIPRSDVSLWLGILRQSLWKMKQ